MAEIGFDLYPAQIEAIEALSAGRHVVLDTPTGSGKSLVALWAHFKATSEGRRSFYTAPIKALVSEKFFALTREFGADRVGLMTGDASVNREAPIICCTAEILSNLVLRGGESEAPPYAVMDEFHYYADPERGTAWQIPLVALRDTTFLLMSATLGDMSAIAGRLEDRTGRPVSIVRSEQRPVPLDFAYRELPLHETVQELRRQHRLPAYVVSFTQRECAERAQALTSLDLCSRAERVQLGERLARADFGTPYGSDMRRMLRVGIAVHHAGLLPRYRLLVEQLAQDGLLKVICGTDTLGVGVNIPIRTVVFTGLAKFDGRRVRLVDAREFKQIGGRAGRKGFDERGSVVCLAPPHAIENRRRAERAGRPRRSRPIRQKRPVRGAVLWNERTFRDLVTKPPPPLRSRFRVTHGMLLATLQRSRDAERVGEGPTLHPDDRLHPSDPSGGYRFLVDLVMRCHDPVPRRHQHLRGLAERFRALRRAGIVELAPRPGGGRRVVVNETLQDAFSLHQTLSLYLVAAVAALDRSDPEYSLDVLSAVEAILEDPRPVLLAQQRALRDALVARLKAERVPRELWRDELDEVTWPKPLEDFLEQTFLAFSSTHPWLERTEIRPKRIARELIEEGVAFNAYVRRYGLQRSEGTLLRYLGEVYRALTHAVPETQKDERLFEFEDVLRAVLDGADASLLGEWERLQALEQAAGER